jgi:hypothetical protein
MVASFYLNSCDRNRDDDIALPTEKSFIPKIQVLLGVECLMPDKSFKLSARISSDNPPAIKPALDRIIGNKGTIKATSDGFEVSAELAGKSAKDLNRMLLSDMRRIEKKTRMRAEWTSGNTTERFFDYVLKATQKGHQA